MGHALTRYGIAVLKRSSGQRQLDLHPETGIGIARTNRTTVDVNRSFGDGQSQSYSSTLRIARLFCPEEGIEDSLQELLGNTRSVIANSNSYRSLAKREIHVDCAALRRMLNRIAQNILHCAA